MGHSVVNFSKLNLGKFVARIGLDHLLMLDAWC